MFFEALFAGQVLFGPAGRKMLDGPLLVGHENQEVHPLEAASVGQSRMNELWRDRAPVPNVETQPILRSTITGFVGCGLLICG